MKVNTQNEESSCHSNDLTDCSFCPVIYLKLFLNIQVQNTQNVLTQFYTVLRDVHKYDPIIVGFLIHRVSFLINPYWEVESLLLTLIRKHYLLFAGL